ncbi:DUF6049 family protein [Jatrophihabitans sp. DSM 45814]
MRGRRLTNLLATAGIFLAALIPGTVAATSATAATTTPGVAVTLISMTPRSPDATNLTQKVTFTAKVVNTSDTTYSDFAVGLERGTPITQQSDLDAAIAKPPATDTLLSSNDADQKKALPAHSSVTVTYLSDPTSAMMCLCATAVYPYALVVRGQTSEFSGFSEVARTQILIPSFVSTPKPVQVGWIWPLLDKPHRSLSDTVFTDNELAKSIAPNGRLYRSLQVVRLTSPKIRMTLVVDPELIDSLAIMAGPSGYSVRTDGKAIKVPSSTDAAAWLAQFKALGATEDVVLTGYSDPDVNAVTRAGLPYSMALDAQVRERITPYLPVLSTDVSWPAGNALTSKALDATIASGASAVVLSDVALSGQNKARARPDAISPLPSAGGFASALVTDTSIEKSVDAILGHSAADVANVASNQQTLISQLAVRAVAEPSQTHFVVVTPDRWVDPNPSVAVATIMATVSNTWSTTLSIPQALGAIKPIDRGPLQTSAESAAAEISPTQMARIVQVGEQVASMRDAMKSDASAALLGGFNLGIQRAESSAWRIDRQGGEAITNELVAAINARLNSVRLVKPSNGSYGLSSSTAPVVVTIVNDLGQDIAVRVSVDAGPGVSGFEATPQTQIVPPGRTQVQLPTHVERLGQFRVTANLTTPDGQQLGQPVELKLRATALGGITKTITIVAGAVLVIALVRRFVLRYRNHRRANRVAGAPV